MASKGSGFLGGVRPKGGGLRLGENLRPQPVASLTEVPTPAAGYFRKVMDQATGTVTLSNVADGTRFTFTGSLGVATLHYKVTAGYEVPTADDVYPVDISAVGNSYAGFGVLMGVLTSLTATVGFAIVSAAPGDGGVGAALVLRTLTRGPTGAIAIATAGTGIDATGFAGGSTGHVGVAVDDANTPFDFQAVLAQLADFQAVLYGATYAQARIVFAAASEYDDGDGVYIPGWAISPTLWISMMYSARVRPFTFDVSGSYVATRPGEVVIPITGLDSAGVAAAFNAALDTAGAQPVLLTTTTAGGQTTCVYRASERGDFNWITGWAAIAGGPSASGYDMQGTADLYDLFYLKNRDYALLSAYSPALALIANDEAALQLYAILQDYGNGWRPLGSTVVHDADFTGATSVPFGFTANPNRRYVFYVRLDSAENIADAYISLTDSHAGGGNSHGYVLCESSTASTDSGPHDTWGDLVLSGAQSGQVGYGRGVLHERRCGANHWDSHAKVDASTLDAGSPVPLLCSGITTIDFDGGTLEISNARSGHLTIIEEVP